MTEKMKYDDIIKLFEKDTNLIMMKDDYNKCRSILNGIVIAMQHRIFEITCLEVSIKDLKNDIL